MTNRPDKERYQEVLRWMRENLALAGSIYREDKKLIVDRTVSVGDPGLDLVFDKRRESNDGWQLNSAAGLTACCYMEALGKVGLRGQGRNECRLTHFASQFMPDFMDEREPAGPKRPAETLYRTYRCGFAHEFADSKASWGREGVKAPYWSSGEGSTPQLNIDRVVKGVVDGIEAFEKDFDEKVDQKNATYAKFFKWLNGT